MKTERFSGGASNSDPYGYGDFSDGLNGAEAATATQPPLPGVDAMFLSRFRPAASSVHMAPYPEQGVDHLMGLTEQTEPAKGGVSEPININNQGGKSWEF